MTNTVLRTCEQSISYLNEVRKKLLGLPEVSNQTVWAVSGLIVTLVMHLIKISDEVFTNINLRDNPNARDDIEDIRKKFNKFIDDMVGHE